MKDINKDILLILVSIVVNQTQNIFTEFNVDSQKFQFDNRTLLIQ